MEVILDDCDPRQCVSTRRDVDSGARAAQMRWGRGGQGGPGPPHPAADCEDVTEKVLTFADTNPRMKLGGMLNNIREYDQDLFLFRKPPPHHVSDTPSNVPVSQGSILGS